MYTDVVKGGHYFGTTIFNDDRHFEALKKVYKQVLSKEVGKDTITMKLFIVHIKNDVIQIQYK